jgi:hypothetical protein
LLVAAAFGEGGHNMKIRWTGLFAAGACLAAVSAAGAQTFGFGFANFSAAVTGSGAVVAGSGIQASSRATRGVYLITFTRDVSTCAIVGSPRGGAGGQVSIAPSQSDPTQISVFVFSKTGVSADLGFTLVASCSSGGP